MNNEHPVPIGVDVGAMWELVNVDFFPELMGMEGMAERMTTVRDNLRQYINTDYCKYLMHSGTIMIESFSCLFLCLFFIQT